MSQYIISLPASRDLRAIADYFAVENVEAGERLLQEFNQKCKQLASFPKMGRQYEALRSGLPRISHKILEKRDQKLPKCMLRKNSSRFVV